MSVNKEKLELRLKAVQKYDDIKAKAARPGSPESTMTFSYEEMRNREWDKILKACNAPVGFTHNDLSLYPRSKK